MKLLLIKYITGHPYLVTTILFVILLLYANYSHFLLGQKIIPIEISVFFSPVKESVGLADNFATDTYRIELLAKFPIPISEDEKGVWRTDYPDCLKKLQEIMGDSAVKIEIFDKRGNVIYNQTIGIRELTTTFSFATRYINSNYVPFAMDPNISPANPDGDSKTRVRFKKNTKYEIKITPINENEKLHKLSPQIIFFGVDDGYYGLRYFIYSGLIIVAWCLTLVIIFVVKLLMRLKG